MNKLNFQNTENLRLVSSDLNTTYCRHCGKRISLSQVGAHLVQCRPEVDAAIQEEYDLKEAFAMQIAG